MKKIMALFLILVMGMQLAACGQAVEKKETEPEVKQEAGDQKADSQKADKKTADQTSNKEEQKEEKKEEEKKEMVTLTLAAAASLQYAFKEELIPMFEKENDSVKIEATYDSSGKLQQQIENGLAADVFFSAATKQMDALQAADYVAEEDRVNLLQNEVVLIVPSSSTLDIKEFKDILNAKSIAIGDPASVPAGQYAKKALEVLGIYEEVEKISSLGTNVTEVLNWVAEGSAEVGIVYASDAATTDKVKVVSSAQKEGLIDPASYPVAVLKKSEHKEQAKAFVEFLQSEKALEVFAKYGFTSAK